MFTRTNYVLCIAITLLHMPGGARAVDNPAPINQRFAAADTAETPSFQRHVVPLLGRLGSVIPGLFL